LRAQWFQFTLANLKSELLHHTKPTTAPAAAAAAAAAP
jgi:hypothetical protein